MRRKKGFTLIELIVVLVILAILAAAALPTFTGYIDYAKEKLCESRRGQILRAFQAVCVDHPDLAAAKDTIELKAAVENKDPLDYLDEIGAYSGDVTCPRYHVKYEMVLSTNAAGVRTVQLQCPCQGDSTLSYIAQAQQVLDKIYKPGMIRDKLISDFYNERGSLLKVSDTFLKGTQFEGKELYWRPYYITKDKVILYAAPENKGTTAGWKASLVYTEGTVYQSTAVDSKGNPAATLINQIYTADPKDLDAWLLSKSFEKVS